MTRGWSIVLGIGLAILWFAGINTLDATPWVTWLDGLGALCAWGIAAALSESTSVNARAGSIGVLAAGLFALWIVALSTSVAGWQSWWNFGFACAFGVLAFVAYGDREASGRIGTMPRHEQNWFKKGA